MKEKTYYVRGMHCASCELLIEKRLLEETGIKAADASLGSESVRIVYEGDAPALKQMNGWFRGDGYTFSDMKHAVRRTPVFKKAHTFLKVLLVFLVLYAIERTGLAGYVNVTDTSALGMFFVFGLLAGVSSCAALIGGILLSLSKGWNERIGHTAGVAKKMVPHLSFHVGRLCAYAIVGGILGAVGTALAFDNTTAFAIVILVVAAIMLLSGLQMAGVRWAERIQIRMPKWVGRRVATGNERRLPFVIGAGTVLLPCGFTLVAEGVALASGGALRGALVMALFVLGTMMPLLVIGLAGAYGSKNSARGRVFSFYAGVVLVIFSLYTMNAQLNVLGFPSVSDVFAKADVSETGAVLPHTEGDQTVRMVATGFSYVLISPATIRAGVPTTLVVENQGVQGCGAFLSARGLVNGFVQLVPGENRITLGSPKKGTYKITCSMGMVPPVTLRVQ